MHCPQLVKNEPHISAEFQIILADGCCRSREATFLSTALAVRPAKVGCVLPVPDETPFFSPGT